MNQARIRLNFNFLFFQRYTFTKREFILMFCKFKNKKIILFRIPSMRHYVSF